MRKRLYIAAIAAAVLAIPFVAVEWLARGAIDAPSYFAIDASPRLLDARGDTLYAHLNSVDHWCWPIELDAISPKLIQAAIAAEDQRFYNHDGVDKQAIVRAAWQNVTSADIHSGASTITMQLVKLQDDLPRSVPGKLVQANRAMRLERNADKRAILAGYLNRVPYGFNLLGCEAAARRFFGTSARELTLPEAALLAGLPKAPSALNPLAHPERARSRRDYVLHRMFEESFITRRELNEALRAPLGVAWHDFPAAAPHLAMQLRDDTIRDGAIKSTINSILQREIETLVLNHVDELGPTITNGAAIVIDTDTAKVLARVGSASFFDTPGGGQVDAIRAMRSPGSALKPFTYAYAMERNALYATEKLLDSTLDYGLYRPRNYDDKQRGLISAAYALQRSLNVPAVMVQERIGTDALAAFLQDAGITTLRRRPSHYGIGLTLGNCEVRLDELAAAYCAVANLGVYRPLREIEITSNSQRSIMSQGAAATIYGMLEQPLPGEFQKDAVVAGRSPLRVALKTGTSTGQRDAWSIVFNRHYVVGVWIGNNDGSRSDGLVGAQAALPLAARIFRSLPAKSGAAWPDSSHVKSVQVCAATGLPVTEWCAYKTEAMLPNEQLLLRKCAVHGPNSDERWPESARGWDLAKRSTTPAEVLAAAATPLEITEPADGAEFVLTGENGADRIRLASTRDADKPVHWFVNGSFAGSGTKHEPVLIDLSPGDHIVSCMTNEGTEDTVRFSVSAPYRPRRFE
jgi:penicillin-binding protein 1C